MGSGVIAVGLAMAALGYGGRYILRNSGQFAKHIPNIGPSQLSGYYKGGFEAKMSKREASLILGISPSAPRNKVREAHRRIMLLNHPDRGGSPYLAAKINEAKDMFESTKGKN